MSPPLYKYNGGDLFISYIKKNIIIIILYYIIILLKGFEPSYLAITHLKSVVSTISTKVAINE